MFDVSSGGIKGARGGTARRSLFPHPHLPHFRRKWHKWASFVKFLDFPPYRNTFSPSMPLPKSGVATGCHWSPWLPAQSLCVVSCSVTKCYLDPPSLAFSNPCFPVFLVYHLNSLHKIMSYIVFSEVASAFKSRVGQQPTRKTKMRGKNEENLREKNEKLRENEERLRKCSNLANPAHPWVRGWLRPWSFSRLSGY